MNRTAYVFLILLVGAVIIGCGGGGGSKNPVSSVPAMQITSISPTSGGPGTQVTISGRSFGTVQGNSILSYSGATISVISWSETQIVATIPTGAAGNGTFQVTVNGVTSNPSTQFSLSNPIISSISPSSGGPGTQVTILGQFFGSSQGTSTVAFNGQRAQVLSWTNSQVVCLAPSPTNTQPGGMAVIITVDGVRPSNSVSFTVSVPNITNINPSSDNIGAVVTIQGTGFGTTQAQGNGSVTIGGNATSIQSWSENSIQIKVPTVTPAQSYNVIVSAFGQQSTSFGLNVSGPQIQGINPNTLEKNKTVVITGYYFGTTASEGPGTISLEDHGLVTPTYWNDTIIQFNCPIGGYLLTQDKILTITVGGLKIDYTVTID